MLSGLMGAILRMDKTVYAVGDRPIYTITGAEPGAVISWTSFKNGQPTGELNAQYGHYIDEEGNWSSGVLDPWPANYAGQWQKQVLLVNPDGTYDQAQATFRVGNVSAASGGNSFSDFFSGSIDLPGLGSVPNIALIGFGVLGFFAFSGGRGRGR